MQEDPGPPALLSRELQALWLTRAERWDEAHDIAQDIHTPTGSWIHALLHTIEGDMDNAAYWYQLAGQPAIQKDETGKEWERLTRRLLLSQSGETTE